MDNFLRNVRTAFVRRSVRLLTLSLICTLASLLVLFSQERKAKAMINLECVWGGSNGEGYDYYTCYWYDDGTGGDPSGGGGGTGPTKQEKINTAIADAKELFSHGGNNCVAFFSDGYSGDVTAGIINALEKLGSQMKPGDLTSSEVDTGIKQWGQRSNATHAPTGVKYDPFPDNQVIVNNNGPFFSSRYPNGGVRPAFGMQTPYPAATRRARVLQTLHELAHLIRKANSTDHLIPNDGGSASQSVANTNTVDTACASVINTWVPAS